MTAPAPLPADPAPSPAVRSVDGDGGVVLMHLETGKYFALTPVAERIWQRLAHGDSVARISRALVEEYGIGEERARGDVERLLGTLAAHGLVVDGARADGEVAPPPELFDAPPLAPPAAGEEDGGRAPWPVRLLEVARAWWALAAADLRLARGGFPRLRRSVAGCPVASRPGAGAALARRWCRRVDAAARGYLRRAWCLQRSAATVRLLRARGLAAELVIGVRRVPFGAHAWVEVAGEVVNDDPQRCRHYQVIDRC